MSNGTLMCTVVLCCVGDGVSRILGCLPRRDCQALRILFDENQAEFGNGKGLCDVLREVSM